MYDELVGAKILIIDAPYYTDISNLLKQAACEYLNSKNIAYDVISVAGALEIPAAISFAEMADKGYGAYIALGCVIRGETYHFDIVANESARAIMDLTVNLGLAIGNGILTVENHQQAIDRADPAKENNKGYWAARVAVEMMLLRNKLFDVKVND
ncbi:6,7-dimethyl-8-ribityllumazine synthase [Bartonella sp. DGB1]|uniref:6,7-dimethyl-8-ribityllumazine synthase n=1 Tax=Bartonella sp. DGB1 TaxID=3239807 RepID=UPI0035243FCC